MTANESEFHIRLNAHNVPARGINVSLCKIEHDNVDDLSNGFALLDVL